MNLEMDLEMDWEKCKPGMVVYRIEPSDFQKGRVHKLIRENGTITKVQVTFWMNDAPHKMQNRTVYTTQIYFKDKTRIKM